jgi:HAD superfamily hydrolase (TIGR01459 family)
MKILHFKDLLHSYDYFLLDAYGVFWGSAITGMLPGAKETMEHLVSLGKTVGILSNTTQLTAKEKDKLSKHGVQEGTHYHFLLTSGEITRSMLQSKKLPFPTPRKKYWLFGSDHPRFGPHFTLFQDTEFDRTENLTEADFIYIAIPHVNGIDQENPDIFINQIKEIADKGIPVLCANPDHFAHEGTPPRPVVRQGAIGHLLQTYGASVYFIGKPHRIVFEKALEKFPVPSNQIIMIGDTPETDIRGARQMNMATALVTKTGIMKERGSEALHHLPKLDQPDHFIESFTL